MKTITVYSSNGELTLNEAGEVIKVDDTSDDKCISNIVKFDLAEYAKYYDNEQITSADILDLGYWYKDEDGQEKYEEPAHDWRKETAAHMKEEKEYEEANASSKEPTHPPTATELLNAALYALNAIPNKRMQGGQYKDTYAIASAISNYQRELLPPSPLDFKNQFTLFPNEMDAGTNFDDFEIQPLHFETKDNKVAYDVCDEGQEKLFGVYIHIPEGGVNCIADAKTKEDAQALVTILEKVARLYIDNGHLK